MTHNKRLRNNVLGAAVAAAATTCLLASGTPAQAATPSAAANSSGHSVVPFDAQGCSGNVCIYLASPSNGTVFVSGWVWKSGFTGYLHLSGPGGLSTNSSTQYRSPGVGVRWNNVPAVVGQYCISGYSSYNGYQGTACESIR